MGTVGGYDSIVQDPPLTSDPVYTSKSPGATDMPGCGEGSATPSEQGQQQL